MAGYEKRVEVTYFPRGEVQVYDKITGKVLFTIHDYEVEDDIDLQEATDQDIRVYVLDAYQEEIQDLLPDTVCNLCSWVGKDEDLKLLPDSTMYYKVCPNCQTDAYLADLD